MTKRVSPFPALALGAAILLAGCAAFPGEENHANDDNYKLGYTDGCGTGTALVPGDPSTIRRDPDLYRSNKAYRAGWKAGFNACRVSSATAPGAGVNPLQGRRNGPSGY
jgi:hypothetical protein